MPDPLQAVIFNTMTTHVDRLNVALAGRYSVVRELGQGGMAVVYLAHDVKHDRHVALKVLKPELAAVLGGDRFLQEIKVTANLQHPNILPLYDSGEAGGFLYYVMPYIESQSLRDRLNRESQLSIREAVEIATTIANALDFAHRHGVVHRDVKPDNVLVQDGQAMIGDFGIAIAVSAAGGSRLTSTGFSLGTPEYMSPEQATDSSVDRRSDEYSLACMLYEMLAGEPPFHAATAQGIIARHVTDALPPLTTVRPGLPASLERVIVKATAKAPADRYPTLSEFATDLNNAVSDGGVRLRRRRISWRGIAGAAVAVLVATSIWIALRPDEVLLDRSRVMVFPLVSPATVSDASVGEDVATMIGHALDGVGSLRWIDGWPLLNPSLRENLRGLTPAIARRLSTSKQCAFAVTGRVVSRGDSADVYLDLLDVAGDSVIARAQAGGPADDAWRTGLRAINGLLPVLMGGSVDMASDLFAQNPTAVAQFLIGERLFRRTQTTLALDAYHAALGADSGFALAAIRGAEAAAWTHDYQDAQTLVNVALRLPLRDRDQFFVEGLVARLRGDADEALEKFEAALAVDPDFAGAWMQVGETFRHLTPRRTGSDSMIELAMRRVLAIDTTAVSPLFHILEIELRHGRMGAAEPLITRFLAANPDPNLEADVRYGVLCARGDYTDAQLRSLARDDPANLDLTAAWLSVGGWQLACAIDFWSAVLAADTSVDNAAAGRATFALTGLHNALVAAGRNEEALRLLDSARVSTDAMRRVVAGHSSNTPESPSEWDRETRLRARNLVILDEIIGIDVGDRSAAVVAEDDVEWGADYSQAYADDLWRRAVWETWRGNFDEAERFRTVLEARVMSLPERMRVLVDVLPIHEALARGDSATALNALRDARPIAPSANLGSHFAYALGLERLIEAKLLLAVGRHRDAIAVASVLDRNPLSYLLYVPASLEVRIAAATALGEQRLASEYEQRLARMRAPTRVRFP